MDFLTWLSEQFQKIMDGLFKILPKSPIIYLEANSEIKQIISYINWFCPIYTWIAILEGWLTCILIWYAVQIVLRWVKAIE